jgi:hypothetical protein
VRQYPILAAARAKALEKVLTTARFRNLSRSREEEMPPNSP